MSATPSRSGHPSTPHHADSVRIHRPTPTISDVIDKYLAHKKRAVQSDRLAQKTLDDSAYYLDRLRAAIGYKPLTECNGLDLTDWLDSQTGWCSANTIKGAVARIQACFNWWARLTDGKNPFKQVTQSWGKPRKPISQSEFDKFFAAVTCRRFGQMWMIIRLTGARPDEIYQLRKDEVRLEPPAALIFDRHKTGRRTGRNRRIPLNGPCVAILDDALAVAEKNGTDFVFLTRRGTPYNKDSFGHQCRRICKRAGIKGVSPYRLRHSVSLEAHREGIPIKTIADFLGTSVQMLSRYYLSYSSEITEDLVNMSNVIGRNKLPEIPRR